MAPKEVKPKITKKSNMEISVYGLNGKEVKKMSLPKDIFQTNINDQLVAQYVRVYMQNQRQGNAVAKTRSEVSGTTKKVYRQKGTGGARHGSKKAPIFVGGGVTFGPLSRDMSLTMSKKQKKVALFSSLTKKVKEGTLSAVENAVLDIKPKTKVVASFIKAVGFQGKKVLIVVPEMKENGFIQSVRNIPNVVVVQATKINPYMIMNNSQTIFVEKALDVVEKHFLNQNAD